MEIPDEMLKEIRESGYDQKLVIDCGSTLESKQSSFFDEKQI